MKKFLIVTVAVLSALSLAISAAAQASTFGQRQALAAAKSYLQFGALLPGRSDPPA